MRNYSVLLAVLSIGMMTACGGYDPDDPEAPTYEEGYEYPTGDYSDVEDQAGGGQPGEGSPWHECMNKDCNGPDEEDVKNMTPPPINQVPAPFTATKRNVVVYR